MVRPVLAFTAAIVIATLPAVGRSQGGTQAPDRVVVDAVVVDDGGAPVEGLTAADFHIREDGASVHLDAVEEIGGNRAAPRTVVLMLDDSSGVRPQLTPIVQQIARSVVNRVTPGDRVDVLRLNHRADEAIGGEAVSLSRIADYRAGMTPFFGRETLETVLQKVSELSRLYERDDAKPGRRTILAIGAPAAFDVREPVETTASLLWSDWSAALADSSRALVNVSVIDPSGPNGRVTLMGRRGLVERTGGESFYNSSGFDRAVDRVWRDAGHYYLVDYTPRRADRELHDLDVSSTRRGVHVRARKVRG